MSWVCLDLLVGLRKVRYEGNAWFTRRRSTLKGLGEVGGVVEQHEEQRGVCGSFCVHCDRHRLCVCMGVVCEIRERMLVCHP